MKKYTLLIIMALLFVTGCESSIYRFLYNSMDGFIYRAITWYVEPSPDQDRFIREKIGTHLQWHRRSELLKYVSTLQGLRERMARGLKKEDINWTLSRVESHETDLFNAVSDDVVSFLTTLDDRQIDRLDERLGERITEVEKKMGAGREEHPRDREEREAHRGVRVRRSYRPTGGGDSEGHSGHGEHRSPVDAHVPRAPR